MPEKESATASSTFMWLKVTSMDEFDKHGDENEEEGMVSQNTTVTFGGSFYLG
jgi:hypothetical protein